MNENILTFNVQFKPSMNNKRYSVPDRMKGPVEYISVSRSRIRSMRRTIVRTIYAGALLALCVLISVAGTTGKISGKITDATTNESLVGANILINGTALGASTDADGDYYIINIPPGIYSVTFRMVGYTAKVIENVRVQVDLTTAVNVSLKQTAVEMNDVVVTMTRKEIQKDLSSSERSMQTDQISALPARDVASVLSLQAGVTKDAGGEIHMRGGRSSEISYMVDGVQVINGLDRSNGISIDDQSIEELKAISGTFNAEYGQALSGIVNIVTKKGADKFSVTATGYAGDYLSFDNLYSVMTNREWATMAAEALTSGRFDGTYFMRYGITTYEQFMEMVQQRQKPWEATERYLDKYNPLKRYDLQLNLSGPLIANSLSFFAAGRFYKGVHAEYGKRYFEPWGIWQPVSDTIHSFAMPDGALVPLSTYDGYSTQSKIYWNLSALTLSYGLYYNRDNSYNYNSYGYSNNGTGGSKYNPDGGRNYYTDKFIHIFSGTYVFSSKTFLELKGSYYSNNFKSYLYEDPFDYRYLPSDPGIFSQYLFRPTKENPLQAQNSLYDFAYWGSDNFRQRNTVRYVSGSIDLTSQLNKYNLVKFGASGKLHDIESDYYTLQFDKTTYRPEIPDKTSPYRTYMTAKPNELAAYIQDKIEFQELIINLGVRFDYFYSNGRVLADPMDPQIYSPFKLDHIYKNYSDTISQSRLVEYTPEERETFWWKKADPKYQISPRLGISFPITDNGVLHFSYGHFFQNPPFQYLYANPNYWITGAGTTNLVGNADLNPERTVMYEVGLQQRLFENLIIHTTAFYRDIRDWVGSGYPIDTYRGLTYYAYANKDHAVAKGLTFSGSFATGPFNFNVDYTYMEAVGTASNPGDAYNDAKTGKAPRIDLVYLNWDQTQNLNVVAGYNNSENGWSATVVGSASSGFPYTPTLASSEATGANQYIGWRENSERRPSTINFDLHIAKMFTLDNVKIQAMVDVRNVFDTRNALNIY
ncbi:MAG: TonB-dependent receptor, partial [Ignavibacteriae bacterium]